RRSSPHSAVGRFSRPAARVGRRGRRAAPYRGRGDFIGRGRSPVPPIRTVARTVRGPTLAAARLKARKLLFKRILSLASPTGIITYGKTYNEHLTTANRQGILLSGISGMPAPDPSGLGKREGPGLLSPPPAYQSIILFTLSVSPPASGRRGRSPRAGPRPAAKRRTLATHLRPGAQRIG